MARSDRFKDVAVVLVRPAGPLNIGAAARAMKNTGFGDLVLVDPAKMASREVYLMAAGSKEIVDRARTFTRLEEALAECHAAFAVTARARHKKRRMTPPEAAEAIEGLRAGSHRVALVFGPEDRGLENQEIDLCQHLIGIPAHSDLTSFNLSQAVLLVCHTLFLSRCPPLESAHPPTLADHASRVRLEKTALQLLDRAGFLTPNREKSLRDTVKRLVFWTDLETRDMRNLLAALRHIEKKLARRHFSR